MCLLSVYSDIDECAANPCDQFCQNIPGSYECSCDSGYTLNSDFHTCDGESGCSCMPDERDLSYHYLNNDMWPDLFNFCE